MDTLLKDRSILQVLLFLIPKNLLQVPHLWLTGHIVYGKTGLKGTQFGVFEKKYNNTVTGQSWDFPEFKGYYSNFYAVEIQTKELPITIVSATDDLFLHLFTPATATNLRGVRGGMTPSFPSGDISVLHGISAIGTKFSRADEEGPQGKKNIYKGEILQGQCISGLGSRDLLPLTKPLFLPQELIRFTLALRKDYSMILRWGASAKKKPCIRFRRLSCLFIFIPRMSKLRSG